ncbi:DUF2062 domain-containing protein [Sphingobacterium lactis]|uniref:DUF2062 domain-containing protein n=1 Tax=Sphingobacterium lactis TaxID=797291 RepID=UPI003EC7222C
MTLSNTAHRICVLIPTYNNAKTLNRVVDGVLQYISDVYVINDGSTDETRHILSEYPNVHVLHQERNQGKGKALLRGFQQALADGFDYAITIDSDGQHYPDDIPVFLAELKVHDEPVLLIGNRDMGQDGIPRKSSFGNRFSNFWFWFETGIKLDDTQSGYRMYPLKHLPKHLFTNKFEFEIEIIVRTAWNGVLVKNVPVKVLYDPQERVSHFRPFRDFTRISILNTVLVIITLLYIKPRNFFRKLKKKSFKQFLKEDILQTQDSPEVKALSLAMGIFIGIIPAWGFQTLLCLSIAVALRWNKALAFLGSNISIPPMIPVIVFLALQIGGFILPTDKPMTFDFDKVDIEMIKIHLYQYVVGSFLLAIFTAVLVGLLFYVILKYYARKSIKNVQ